MSDQTKVSPPRHWAYSLPDLPHTPTPYWARETVAEHRNPDYWAMLWGWSGRDVSQAKEAAYGS